MSWFTAKTDKLLNFKTSLFCVDYKYGYEGRLIESQNSGGVREVYTYSGDIRFQYQIEFNGEKLECPAVNDTQIKMQDFLGLVSVLNFSNGKLISVSNQNGEALYDYDEYNHPLKVTLSNGSVIAYKYGNKSSQSKRGRIKFVMYPFAQKL